VMEGDISIENGHLTAYAPLRNVAKFVKLQEIDDIKFSTLKNHIRVIDDQLIIPQMEIKSSAIDLFLSGNHTFDANYTYNVKVLLSDVLWGKARRQKLENSEFGVIEDEGSGQTSLYLKIEGISDKVKVSYDGKSAIGSVKEGLTQQKKELKSIFKNEFGWFKNDTTVVQKPTSATRPKVEWDESDNAKPLQSTEKQPKKVEPKKKSEKFKVEWE
jgi:hypothetical protein